MTDPRTNGVSFRTLALTVGALVVLFAGWSYRESIGEMFKRPASVAQPVVNVPAPVVNIAPTVEVKAIPELPLFAKDKHEYEIAGRRCVNVVIWRGGWISFNDAETGEWKARFGGEVKRLRGEEKRAEAGE